MILELELELQELVLVFHYCLKVREKCKKNYFSLSETNWFCLRHLILQLLILAHMILLRIYFSSRLRVELWDCRHLRLLELSRSTFETNVIYRTQPICIYGFRFYIHINTYKWKIHLVNSKIQQWSVDTMQVDAHQ